MLTIILPKLVSLLVLIRIICIWFTQALYIAFFTSLPSSSLTALILPPCLKRKWTNIYLLHFVKPLLSQIPLTNFYPLSTEEILHFLSSTNLPYPPYKISSAWKPPFHLLIINDPITSGHVLTATYLLAISLLSCCTCFIQSPVSFSPIITSRILTNLTSKWSTPQK